MKTEYRSKLFRNGNILLALTLAIRGVPRTWQPEQQPISRDFGRQIYASEFELLDGIDPKLYLFQSGVLGAALITTALDPAVLSFWDEVSRERWVRRLDGRTSAAGWLIREIRRHSGNREIAVRPEYQHYLFQASLAAAAAWGRSCGGTCWLGADPERVDIARMLERVRAKKGVRRSSEGFRPLRALEGRIPVLARTEIEHTVDWSLAAELARRAAGLAAFAVEQGPMKAACRRLRHPALPPEYAAPGALAAAISTGAEQPGSLATWESVFARRWSHDPSKGSDLPGIIVRTIEAHNRYPAGIEGQAQLFARIQQAFRSSRYRGESEYRARNLPKASACAIADLANVWRDLSIPDGPRIHAGHVEPVLHGPPGRKRRACEKRKRLSRHRTGRMGEEIFERFHARHGLPRPGKLIDCRHAQCGYDYELFADDACNCVIEAKFTDPKAEIALTELQWEVAQKMRDRYWLAVVWKEPNGAERVRLIQDPAGQFLPRRVSKIVVQTSYRIPAKAWK